MTRPTPPQIHVSREWLELLPQLPVAGRLIVIGPPDSGKTTLCRWLLSKLAGDGRIALVDADLGQTQIGPPGCVGWRLVGGETEREEFYFVGDTTPATLPEAALAATFRATQAAEAAGAQLVLLDTSGYLRGRGGYEYKAAKLTLLAPAHVLFLGDNVAVRRLLAAFHNDERLVLHRLPQSEFLQQKTRKARAAWRQERWRAVFEELELRTISLRGKALIGLPTAAELRAHGFSWPDLQGLLLGFADTQRRGLGLGLLQSLYWPGQEMIARAPKAAEEAACIQFGLLRLTATGHELGRLPLTVRHG